MPVINLNPWPYAYILQLATEASYLAEAQQLRPALASEVIMNYRHSHRFNIPFIGGYVHPEWERVDEIEPVFVDTTGKAVPGDPAITAFEFSRRAAHDIKSHPGEILGYGVIEQGQFQVLIATYRRKEAHANEET